MDPLLLTLTECGEVASARQLAAAGITRHHLDRALREGRVLRLRRGWFAVPSTSDARRAAIAAGGILTCASALSERGLWVLSETALHVAVAPNAVRTPSDGVRLHWRRWPGCGPESSSLDGLRSSLLHAVVCLPMEEAVMALDSAVNGGWIDVDDLMRLRPLAPVGRRAAFDLVDARSESGLETRIRLAAVRLRVRVRPQLFIEGVGRLDNVLGDRLCVETDGRRFHTGSVQLEEDYRRSLALQQLGYAVVRLSSTQVLRDWPASEAALAAMIRRGDHLWRGRRPRDGG